MAILDRTSSWLASLDPLLRVLEDAPLEDKENLGLGSLRAAYRLVSSKFSSSYKTTCAIIS